MRYARRSCMKRFLLIAILLIAGCSAAPDNSGLETQVSVLQATLDAVQEATTAPTIAPTDVPPPEIPPTATEELPVICRPTYFETMSYGYVPTMELSGRITSNIDCTNLQISWDNGYQIFSGITPDGLSLVNCTFFTPDDETFACSISITRDVNEASFLNAIGTLSNGMTICLGESTGAVSPKCQ